MPKALLRLKLTTDAFGAKERSLNNIYKSKHTLMHPSLPGEKLTPKHFADETYLFSSFSFFFLINSHKINVAVKKKKENVKISVNVYISQFLTCQSQPFAGLVLTFDFTSWINHL